MKESTEISQVVESVSASMQPVEAVIRELAQSDASILLLGEEGVGKHATARRIHEMSRRRERGLRSFRCSILKPEDLEGLRGSGRNVPAVGTVFLEEVSDLGAGCQALLLESLLPRNGTSEGQERPRFIFGSARDLDADVNAGRLSEELYYRVRGVCLRLPPLRQRKDDIPRVTESFLRRFAHEFSRPVVELSAETQRLLQGYSWPENFDELEDVARVLAASGDERLAMGGLRSLLQKPAPPVSGGRISLKAAARAASQEAERELILEALSRTRWNRRRAARELQISYKALLYKLKQISYEGHRTP